VCIIIFRVRGLILFSLLYICHNASFVYYAHNQQQPHTRYDKIKRAFGAKAKIVEADFKRFLQKENPGLKLHDLNTLYRMFDRDNDGSVDLQEVRSHVVYLFCFIV
jgi:Ca2+-binding EF-hand superfamily protein